MAYAGLIPDPTGLFPIFHTGLTPVPFFIQVSFQIQKFQIFTQIQTFKFIHFLIFYAGLIPDPKIHKRESSVSLSSPHTDAITFSVMSCDLPGNYSNSTMTSLTLSATGEFFSCSGGSEKSSFTSIPLDEVERGLDLKGTEKGITYREVVIKIM